MTETTSPSNLAISASPELWQWLADTGVSIAFTTYQTNRLLWWGANPNGQLAVNERLFDKPMGLYADGDRMYMSTRYQIWQLENRLSSGEEFQGYDRVYFPSVAHTTGDINCHDVVLNREGELVFVNTDFSCLAKLRSGYSFEPIWTPPFITKLAAEDRCHLNGLAVVDGEPTYVTACSATDEPAGWRHHEQRLGGGVVIYVPTKEIIASGLSMPHSPRYYQGKVWLLNSGTGELGYLENDRFVGIAFCPGFVRGLAFWGDFALVGLSKLRSHSFSGLALQERLNQMGQTSQCGLMIVDLRTGNIVEWLHLDGLVEELFDVVVLPDTLRPQSIGFQNENIDRLVTFPNSGGLVITKPTVKRPSVGAIAPVAGLPRPSLSTQSRSEPATAIDLSQIKYHLRAIQEDIFATAIDLSQIKYQRVYHLTPDNLAPYDAMTYPSLQQRWKTQPPTGELIATSAAIAGEMIGLAVAEIRTEGVDLLSIYVLPPYQNQGIDTKLLAYLQESK